MSPQNVNAPTDGKKIGVARPTPPDGKPDLAVPQNCDPNRKEF
jgi:hypothetical protein